MQRAPSRCRPCKVTGVSGHHSDPHYMQLALALAQAQLGRTAPNPSVGCVIVANGAIIGEGVHTGIHSAIYPGRMLPPGCSTIPGEVISK